MLIRKFERWPFEDFWDGVFALNRIRRDLDSLLQSRETDNGMHSSAGVFPLMNVSEDHENYYVRSEIPGMTLDKLDVSVTGRSLTVGGERKIPSEENTVRYHRREREAGKFRRQLNLPTDVEGERVQAKYRHGILMVVLPKAESAQPRKISISG